MGACSACILGICTTHTKPRQGWECPRCQAVNGPHVERCACSPHFAAPGTAPATPWPNPFEPWPNGWTVTS